MFNENINWSSLIEKLKIYAVVYEHEDRIEVSVHTGDGDPNFIIYKNPIKVVLDLTNDMKFAYNLECWSPIHNVLDIINSYVQKDDRKEFCTYICPKYIIALLENLDDNLCRVQWNINQKEYDSPFGNTGNRYRNSTFEVEAYNWNDESQEYNFKYNDIEIRWYKYLGRCTTINREVTPEEAIDMYNKCLESILKEDI